MTALFLPPRPVRQAILVAAVKDIEHFCNGVTVRDQGQAISANEDARADTKTKVGDRVVRAAGWIAALDKVERIGAAVAIRDQKGAVKAKREAGRN